MARRTGRRKKTKWVFTKKRRIAVCKNLVQARKKRWK